MMRITTFSVLLLLASLSPCGFGQVSLQLQDLQVSSVATGLVHAGDIVVDGTGNIWVVESEGTPGGNDGSLAKVTPQGSVTPQAVTGLSQMGELRRGTDGNVYFWTNTGATTTALAQLLPTGTVNILGTWSNLVGAGIAEAGGGSFYLGAGPGAQGGIWLVTPGGGAPTFVALGIIMFGGFTSQSHLVLDQSGQLYVGNYDRVVRVDGPNSSTTLHYAIPCLGPFCPPVLRDLELGWYGELLTFDYFPIVIDQTPLIGVRGENSTFPVATFGPEATLPPPPALAPGLAGDWYLLDRSGNLYRFTGTPATLALQYPTPSQLQIFLDAPAGSPLILAADAPGFEVTLPGYGTFHTTLGTGPNFFVVTDGVGAFLPPDPNGVAPWTLSLPTPSPQLQLQLTLEAYVVSGAAANGLFLISNPLNLWL